MPKTISQQIAEFAVNLKYDDLPDDIVNEVKRYLYDSVGCAYGGLPASQCLH
jgi:2-methylcitrate dehydratase